MPFQKILVATDLRVESDEAVRQAMAIAQGRHKVALCHVVPDVRTMRPLLPHLVADDLLAAAEIQGYAQEELDRCLSRLGSPDVEIFFESGGAAHERILERARAWGANLLIVGAPQRWPHPTGTADGVVRGAHIPVLAARGSGRGPVLAAIDFSEDSELVLDVAAGQADALRKDLVALHAVDVEHKLGWIGAMRRLSEEASVEYARRATTHVDDAAKELVAFAARIAPGARGEVHRGRASEVVRERAAALDAALVVVGTRGRTGLDGILVGSVAQDIVRRAPCSVLVVRRGEG
jgi:universal stress protein A